MHRFIEHNASLITQLRARIHDAFRAQSHGPGHQTACKEFHKKYDGLALPGGYELGLKKLAEGDAKTVETALTFLEASPYFFRSQYMMKKITRLLKRTHLSADQTVRFEKIIASKLIPHVKKSLDDSKTMRASKRVVGSS